MLKTLAICAVAAVSLAQSNNGLIGPPDAFKTMEVVCHENGYAFESTTLVTPDGYVLTLGRIPGKVTDATTQRKPAVLFMHAQDCDMMEYVSHRADVAPAFVLAEQGYDVWLGNNRGSQFSHAHLELDPHSREYWDFYQEDMARKDLPTIIDHILAQTGHEKLTYIGHSEGTTQFFLGASLTPDYFTAKVNLFVGLAPVASTANISAWYLVKAANHLRELEFALMRAGVYNLFPPMPRAMMLEDVACSLPFIDDICKNIYGLFHNEGVDDPQAGETFLSHEPSGQSWRTFMYYGQSIRDQHFALYDYGRIQNQKVYGSAEPPLVPMQDYAVPTALFSGSLDGLATPADVAWLKSQISEHVVFAQEYKLDHFSFVIAKDMSYFTRDVVNVIQQYNPTGNQAFLQ